MPDWRLPGRRQLRRDRARRWCVSDLHGRGSPTRSSSLLVAALLVMAATLALVFRARAAAAAAGGRAGRRGADLRRARRWPGASLTMASIGVLPVLIGLAVDYAIQFQSRVRRRPAATSGRAAAARRARRSLTAGAATAAGFLVLALSPVPMVRGFGLLLVAGIVAGASLATFTGGRGRADARLRGAGRRGRCGPRRARWRPAWRGAGELLTADAPGRAVGARRDGARRRAALRAATARAAGACSASAVVARRRGLGARHADARGVRRATSSSPRTCPRCATCARCRSRPASAARST